MKHNGNIVGYDITMKTIYHTYGIITIFDR